MKNTKNVVPITSTPATCKPRKQKQTDEQRFKSHVSKPNANGCELWVGATTGNYGMFKVGGQNVYAHRFAWSMHNGEAIPSGAYICHKCDVPTCTARKHLFVGDAKANAVDKQQKGRSTKGRSLPRNPLTTEEIDKLVALSAAGASNYRVARELGRTMPGVAYALKVHRDAIELKRIRLQFADALQALNDHLAPSIAELQKITKKAA